MAYPPSNRMWDEIMGLIRGGYAELREATRTITILPGYAELLAAIRAQYTYAGGLTDPELIAWLDKHATQEIVMLDALPATYWGYLLGLSGHGVTMYDPSPMPTPWGTPLESTAQQRRKTLREHPDATLLCVPAPNRAGLRAAAHAIEVARCPTLLLVACDHNADPVLAGVLHGGWRLEDVAVPVHVTGHPMYGYFYRRREPLREDTQLLRVVSQETHS